MQISQNCLITDVGSSLFDLYLCCCHTQQLAILDTFKEFEGEGGEGVTLLAASDTCKRLSAHLHKSNIGKMLRTESSSHPSSCR